MFHKPSHEPYVLPYNSIHQTHIKQNLPYSFILKAFRYCSTYEAYLRERETLRVMFILNKYPNEFIDKQFNEVLLKFGILINRLNSYNYPEIREKIIQYTRNMKKFQQRLYLFILLSI